MSSDQPDDLNQQLQALALVAQQHPPLSRERQSALRQLVNGILKSGRLCRPQRGRFLGTYEDIYAEAQQELLLYICKNIDKYSPERAPFMTWVNMLMERRFFREAIPRVLGPPAMNRVTLADLENVVVPEEATTLLDCVREVVEADREDLFKSAHIRGRPEVTFQALFQRRLSGQRWQDIATEFGISTSTAETFFSRKLQKFSPNIRKCCSDSAV